MSVVYSKRHAKWTSVDVTEMQFTVSKMILADSVFRITTYKKTGLTRRNYETWIVKKRMH